MFAHRFSLHRSEYTKIKQDSRLYQSTNFGVLIRRREGIENPRFGIIISNKVSKLATHRNRVRRAFRDALRRNWKKVDSNFDMVFLIKPGIEKVLVSDIMKEIEAFLNNKEYDKDIPKN
jgi:ribonuclease P protein component